MSHRLRAVILWTAVLGAWMPAGGSGIAAEDHAPSRLRPALSFRHVVVDDGPPANPWLKCAGDFNGDRKLDIAIGGQAGSLVWYANPGWRKYPIAGDGWSTVGGAVGDVNGDGDADVVPGAQVWFENPRPAGDPSRTAWRPHRISDVGSHDALLIDLDRDGRPDLVARDQSGFGGPLWRVRSARVGVV